MLRQFFFIFWVGFVATWGLFFVFDAFANIDGFQKRSEGQGTGILLTKMAEYYFFQSFLFFDRVGSVLIVVAVMVIFTQLQRHREIHPLLAAGVPTYRLLVPFLIGTLAIIALLFVNQELFIPRIVDRLNTPRGVDESYARKVDPIRDFTTNIEIGGKQLQFGKHMLREAVFVLPVPHITYELTTLRAREAFYRPQKRGHPSGWLLRGVKPRFNEVNLTATGKRYVIPQSNLDDIFIITNISFDQLCNRSTSFRLLSTRELVRRIKTPVYATASVQGLILHLHERATRPLVCLISVFLTLPLIVRKESSGLFANVATCTVILMFIFAMVQGFLYLGKVNFISPAFAAWAPVIVSGSLGTWLFDSVQT